MEKELDLQQVKKIIVGILQHIDEVCKKNDIPYFLAYGSALGGFDIMVLYRGTMMLIFA